MIIIIEVIIIMEKESKKEENKEKYLISDVSLKKSFVVSALILFGSSFITRYNYLIGSFQMNNNEDFDNNLYKHK